MGERLVDAIGGAQALDEGLRLFGVQLHLLGAVQRRRFVSECRFAQRADHVVGDLLRGKAQVLLDRLDDHRPLHRAHDRVRLFAAELVQQQAAEGFVGVQAPAPAVVGLRRDRLADHVEPEQQADRLDGDERRQDRLLELVHRLFQCGHGGVVLAGCGGDLGHQVLRRQDHRAKVGLAALAQLHEADRYTKEPGDAEGLVVADVLQLTTNAFRADINAEQRLRKRAFFAHWWRRHIQAVEQPLDRVGLERLQPEHALVPLEGAEGGEQLFELRFG